MRKLDWYGYSLTLTSQFPFCGIPFRLDTYSRCQFACRYCFASARGGNANESRIQISRTESFAKRLQRVHRGLLHSVNDEMLARNIPIHIGGMADPFPPIERELQVTLGHLRACADYSVPAIISTKSCLVVEDPWLQTIANGRFAVQISIPTSCDKLGREIDAGAPLPSQRLAAIRTLSAAGVSVSCRIQPALPGRTSDVLDLIHAAAAAGVSQIAVEHLKLPIERNWPHRELLNKALGLDLGEYYSRVGAKRVGREWILPLSIRIPAVLAYRKLAKKLKVYFGAADNDLLHLSDGSVCCSGADLLGLGSGFEFNFLSAIRHRTPEGLIRFDSISKFWRPNGSIQRILNSRSRGLGDSVEKYIRANWNGRPNGCSPTAFHGVEEAEAFDAAGYRIYKLSPKVTKLM